MKFVFLLSICFLLSCSTKKIYLDDYEHTQDLKGKINNMTVNKRLYNPSSNDSIGTGFISKIYYDHKNSISRVLEDYSNFECETQYIYKQNLLSTTLSKFDDRIKRDDFKYDNKNNLIQHDEYTNDKLYFTKTFEYDTKNNIIKKTTSFPNDKIHNWIDIYKYDYKNRYVYVQSTKEIDQLPKDRYLKFHFNKIGLMTRTETITSSKKGYINYGNINEYDKNGNITKSYSLDSEGKIKTVVYYKYRFDNKGNIIVQEKFLGDKLVEKTIYIIVYRD